MLALQCGSYFIIRIIAVVITNFAIIGIIIELSGRYRSPPEAGPSLGALRMIPAGRSLFRALVTGFFPVAMRPCSATWWCCTDSGSCKSQEREAQNLGTFKILEGDGVGLNLILKVKKVKLKEVKLLTQHHTARLPGLFPHYPTLNVFIASSPPTQGMNE